MLFKLKSNKLRVKKVQLIENQSEFLYQHAGSPVYICCY